MAPASAESDHTATLRHRSLLALLILTWAVSWPVVKIGVSTVPPLWFACLRYVVAAACLFPLVALRRELAFPPRPDWPLVAVTSALQMAAYPALTATALTRLPPGRASVLAFSTPLWVIPLAAWWLHERLSRRALLGVSVGLSGVLAIATPSLQRDGTGQTTSYALLLAAAAGWAVSIVFIRSHRFTASALALAPWQMAAAAAILLPLAAFVEGSPPPIGASGAIALGYVGPLATAFATWAVVETGRHFRASTMSMALLATPCLGILISALALGEAIDASLIVGVALTAAGIRLTTSQGGSPVTAPSPARLATADAGEEA